MSSSDTNRAVSPAYYAVAARDVCYHGVASLTFLVWHCLVTLDDEVQYIWTMRNTSPFKWVYFFLRYVAILAHVAHNFFIEQLANGSNPSTLCNIWLAYVLVLSQVLATLLELILASRVFALYNRSGRVAFLLLFLISAEGAGSVRMLWLERASRFHGTCLLVEGSADHRYQSFLAFAVHCVLISLTWIKYVLALQAGWGRTPLVSLVVRDSSTVYASIILLLASVILVCGLQNERGVAIVFWATSLFSISGCRVILSMERFASKDISRLPPLDAPLLTSQFRISTFELGRTFHQHDSNVALSLTLESNGNIL